MLIQNNFISGEKIASICDVSIYARKYLSQFPNIVKHTKNVIYANEEMNVDLNNYHSFFVKSDHLPFFIEKVLPQINKKFILVTHNSDKVVGKENQILNHPFLEKWYGLNILPHLKTDGIPIGLENSQWKGGNYSIFLKYKDIPKTNLLYLNFSLKTNKTRKNVLNLFLKKGFVKHNNLPWEEYIKFLSSFKYCVCPIGNGPDTHRLWECLYLGVVPISEKHPCLYPHFQDLPILWVNSFNDVNETLLKNFKITQNNLEKTKLTYWMNKFKK